MGTGTEQELFGNSDWIGDILSTGNTGLWSITIDLKTGAGKMVASAMMLELLGLESHPSPEACYEHWFSRIDPGSVDYIAGCVEKMAETGQFMEVQYPWRHPVRGKMHVRCGGKRFSQNGDEMELRGYHQNISELVQLQQDNIRKKRELEEIAKEKERYNTLFESVMCGIVQYRLKENGRVVFKSANSEAIRIFGYTPEAFWAVDNWKLENLVAPEDWERISSEIAVLGKPGDRSHFEYRLLKRDGSPCWVIGRAEMLVDEEGEPVFRSVFLDIDESKKAEIENALLAEQVQAGNELLRLALEHTQAYEFFYYPDSRVCIVPERTQKHYGCKAHYAGMPESFADDFVDDGSREAFLGMYERIHAGEKTATADFRSRDENVWCRVTLSTVTVGNGRRAFVVGIVEDVTREKTFELENTELHAIYDYILNSDYDLMGVGDLEKGRYSLRFSDKFDHRGMPLTGEIVQGNDWMLERFVHPDDRARMEQEWAVERVVSELEKSDSYSYYFLSNEDPPRYKAGKLSYFRGEKNRLLLTFRDIHDMRMQEERVRQTLTDALKVAEKANNAKSDFLSKMSHDMRTPMNGIIGLAMIAEKHCDEPERMREYLTKISVASRHLLGLINDVLDMSKIEAGRIVLIEEDFDLVALLQGVVDIVMPAVKERQQAIRVDVEKNVFPFVTGDSLRLQQVFMNLISNAVKFTPAGGHIGVGVSQTVSPFDGYGAYHFVFSDDGIGMSPAFMERLFLPFEREENSMTSRVSGTGLGMPISKAIVEMMNGSIDVESERGRGTVFTVTVHLKQRHAGAQTVSEELEGLAVLVVDDDRKSADSTVAGMKAAGLQPTKTVSAREALAMAVDACKAGNPYAAVVIDLKNPDMDGLELTRRLHLRLPETTRIVMALSPGGATKEADAKLAGVDVCLMRPVKPAWMVSALAALLKQPGKKKDVATDTDFTGKRVLLVEDNELNLEIAFEILKMTNVEVETAEDGRQALEKVAASPAGWFDLVFMDIQMPVMDGYEATKAIRALDRADVKTLPIVAMTANAFPEDIRRAFQAGMNGHLVKPIELAALYSLMTIWLK